MVYGKEYHTVIDIQRQHIKNNTKKLQNTSILEDTTTNKRHNKIKRLFLTMGKGLQQHIVRAIVTVFFIIYTVALSAQNNQYRMDDGLFKLYEKAYKERKTLAGKILADTIIERASCRERV